MHGNQEYPGAGPNYHQIPPLKKVPVGYIEGPGGLLSPAFLISATGGFRPLENL